MGGNESTQYGPVTAGDTQILDILTRGAAEIAVAKPQKVPSFAKVFLPDSSMSATTERKTITRK